MTKIEMLLRQLHRDERKLALRLSATAARHHADQEIFYGANDLARWSRDHLRELSEIGPRYGVRLRAEPHTHAWTAPMQARLSEQLSRRPETGLLLLTDLRRLHQQISGVSLDWELLAQAAQAAHMTPLLELAQRCHPQTLRQLRWTNGMLKVLSPQVLSVEHHAA